MHGRRFDHSSLKRDTDMQREEFLISQWARGIPKGKIPAAVRPGMVEMCEAQ